MNDSGNGTNRNRKPQGPLALLETLLGRKFLEPSLLVLVKALPKEVPFLFDFKEFEPLKTGYNSLKILESYKENPGYDNPPSFLSVQHS